MPPTPATEYLLTVSRMDFSRRKQRWDDPAHHSTVRRIGSPELPLAYPGALLSIGSDGHVRRGVPLLGPKGMLFVDGRLLVACFSELRAFTDDLGGSSVFMSEPWCNDLHSLRPAPNGTLVAVSGIDAAFELSSDGKVLWEWWAVDHGFATAHDGEPWSLGKEVDHRLYSYPVERQSTHINAIAALDESTLVATMLHTNSVVTIDRGGDCSVLVANVGRPHAVRVVGDGLITYADTTRGAGVCARVDGGRAETVEEVTIDTPWVHDAFRHDEGWLIVDGASSRVVHTDRTGTITRVDQFDPEWCLYEVLPARG